MQRFHYLISGLRELSKNRRLFFFKFKSYIYFFFKVAKGVPKPLLMQLEPTVRCNLQCVMCYVRKCDNPPSDLTQEKFKIIVEKTMPLHTVNISGLGEPLLNNDLENFVSSLKEAGVDNIFFITNGQLLTKEKVQNFLTSGLNTIIISMEAGEWQVYEKIRVGASLARLEDNIQNLNSLGGGIIVRINTVLLPKNIEDLSIIFSLIDFAQRNGIKFIDFGILDDVYTDNTIYFFLEKKNLLKKKLILIEKYAKKREVRVTFPSTKVSKGSCTSPWLFPFMTCSGDILPCCTILHLGLAEGRKREDVIEEFNFGNINEGDLISIWNSEKATTFRMGLAKRTPNKYCIRCSKYFGLK